MSDNDKNGARGEKDGNIPHQTLEVEIINPDGTREKVESGGRRGWKASGPRVYGATWNFAGIDNAGCSSAMVTIFLFLVCLAQFGALAGIGFLAIHTVGSVMGSVHFARSLMRGQPASIWTWRVGNWIVSFLLVAFLAGNTA